jgi:hypothetical protein
MRGEEMTDLSPAAQAVLDAADNVRINVDWWPEGMPEIVAAALRAAVAQTQRHPGHDIWQCDADDLLAIADELDAQ